MSERTWLSRALSLHPWAPMLGFAFLCLDLGCSSDETTQNAATGGTAPSSGGGGTTGGTKASTGGSNTGGTLTGGTTGGTPTGGAPVATGGVPSTGGTATTGGVAGSASGGSAGSGGKAAGGTAGAGGSAGSAGAAGASAGAGGASGSGGSGGGSTGFDPCPAKGEPCKILPLGDSITDGIGFSGGYRVELFRKALTDMKTITFVGGSMNGPAKVDNVTFPKSHEGHSGWTISQIDGIVPAPALDPTPDIVLLHIGTNDMRGGVNGAADRLGALIDQIITDLPDALLVVSNIIPYPSQSSQVTTYNMAVPGVVQMRITAGKHVLYVDQFKDFPNNQLGDGVHPNEAGYARMAGVWYTAIKDYLR